MKYGFDREQFKKEVDLTHVVCYFSEECALKTVAIITRHAIANYGSFLQTLASQIVFESLGVHAVIVDYVKKNESPFRLGVTIVNNTREKLSNLQKIPHYVVHLCNAVMGFYIFLYFRKRNKIRQTKRYNSIEELSKELPQADIFCTGSDQVWNTIHGDELDPAYFLSFVPDNVKKISLSASFGRDRFSNKLNLQMSPLLKRYDAISVREAVGVSILNQMGIVGAVIPDPTLLVSKDVWLKYASKPKNKDYILVYQLRKNTEFAKYVMHLKKTLNRDVVRVSLDATQFREPGRLKYFAPPEKFVGYIADAHLVITDSFHGTAFCISLNIPFVCVLPDRYSGRLASILDTFELSHRIITCDNMAILSDEIDWTPVNNKLSELRQHGLDWLEAAIGQEPDDEVEKT